MWIVWHTVYLRKRLKIFLPFLIYQEYVLKYISNIDSKNKSDPQEPNQIESWDPQRFPHLISAFIYLYMPVHFILDLQSNVYICIFLCSYVHKSRSLAHWACGGSKGTFRIGKFARLSLEVCWVMRWCEALGTPFRIAKTSVDCFVLLATVCEFPLHIGNFLLY